MKNINNFKAEKYTTDEYIEVESNIYKTIEKKLHSPLSLIGMYDDEEEYKIINELEEWNNKKEYKDFYYIIYNGKKYYKDKFPDGDSVIWTEEEPQELYVTSLMFEQEKEYGEGENAGDISQYPLDDIAEKFFVTVSDFYDELNTSDSMVCYREFASTEIDDIRNLRSIIGKHVYNKEKDDRILLIIDNE